MIKKVKISKVSIKEEKEITANGKKYNVCNVGILVADDCSSGYAGKWISSSVFGYTDPKDPKKNRTATSKAEYFKSQVEGKEEWLDIKENKVVNELTGEEKVYINGKTLSKAKKEVAEEMSK